jgi:integrase
VRAKGADGVMRPAGRPIDPRWVNRVFRETANRAGLPKTIRFHDLRHTAITNAISQGEDIMLVAAFAGHAKTSTTTDVYGHLMPQRAQDAARRMRSVSHNPSHTLPTNVAEQRDSEAQTAGVNP